MLHLRKLLLLLISIGLFVSCAELKKALLLETTPYLKDLEFRLAGVDQLVLSDVPFSRFSSLSDLSLKEGLALTRSFAAKKMPASFTLNLGVTNPNDGTNGIAHTAAWIKDIPWTLYIDDRKTLEGGLAEKVTVSPDTGEMMIPLAMNLDLFEFFSDKTYGDLLALALSLGGKKGSASRLRLMAKPVVDTPHGPIEFPEAIEILPEGASEKEKAVSKR